ncbi:hypothetical protein [Mycobacterium sp. C31M]
MASAQHECTALGFSELSERARQELWLAHDGDGIERFTMGYVRFWRGELNSAREDILAVTNSAGSGYPDMARMMLTFTISTLGDMQTWRR